MSKVCWCIEHVWCVVCRYWFVEISRQQMVWLNIVVQTSHKSRCLCRGWLSFWMQLLIATFIRSVLPTFTNCHDHPRGFEAVFTGRMPFLMSKNNSQTSEGTFLSDQLASYCHLCVW